MMLVNGESEEKSLVDVRSDSVDAHNKYTDDFRCSTGRQNDDAVNV